ncbi:hypothetical protein F5Y12DRAFT_496260 [Xylaria sp. FL1777]|nr:hypothetical protein F5Y12DRAFT_496260 [Xylaria sp. FL1777]
MEPRSGLRPDGQGSMPSPADPDQRNLSSPESSDEDDDDIPANKLPSVSPSKRRSLPDPGLHVTRAKRSLSDAARGSIVLYPGSKKPRNGYNMAPVSRESLPRSTSNFLRVRIPTRSRTDSPSSGDDVREGLVRSVNDALRHIHTRQAQYGAEQELEPGGAPAFHTNAAEAEEPEDAGDHVDDQEPSLPPDTPHLALHSLPLDSDLLIEKLLQATDSATTPVGATPNRENQAETTVEARVDTVSLPLGEICEVPNSLGQPIAPEGHPEAPSQKLQPVKKRGRPPKRPADILPNTAPYTEKKKSGPRRKNYSRPRDETDKDYTTRAARLQEQPMPFVLGSDIQLLQQASPALDGAIPHIALEPDLQLKSEPEDVVRAVNYVEPSVREGSVDNRSQDLGHDDEGVQYEPVEYNDDGHPNSNADETDGMLSDFIDGFDSDCGGRSGVDQSFEDSFVRDVNAFKACQTSHPEDNDAFEDPMDDDVLAVHLDHQPLKQLCRLLGDKSWAGVKGGWQWQYFHYERAKTKPARALLRLLTKLERLYEAVPNAPKLKEQNQFLREHADMLRDYFYKIKMVVDHIRTQRLEIPERNETAQNTDPCKRGRMVQDLVLYVIPMLAHVLASTWKLGGKTWAKASREKSSFTSTAIELLKRALGWIMVLHRRLLSELERCPFEEKPEGQREEQAWRRRNDKRKEIGTLLDDLCQVISAAPDQLVETEVRIKEELKRRQRQLRREEQLKIEQKTAEEARQALVAERKKQSLLSIRAIHGRHESPTTSSGPSSSVTLRSTEWSIEEQRLLFLRIQASFPVCPDLNDLRWELNKTVAQTVAMTEQILEKMLRRVLIGYSAEERAAELGRIMHNSGVVGT